MDRNMCQNMTMFKVNIHEAKAKLSEFIEAVERGEQVVICRRNRPVAELRRLVAARTTARPLGGAVADFEVPDSFFAPLPDEVLDGFYGVSTAEPERSLAPRAVAERPAAPDGGRSPARGRRSRR